MPGSKVVGGEGDLASQISALVRAAFAQEGLAEGFGAVRRSDRPDLAPFQGNGALGAAKAAGRNPREIAQAIAARLAGQGDWQVDIAGPGFLNCTPSAQLLAARAAALFADGRCGASIIDPAQHRRVMIDYGGPNIAKPMHVGHLRSSIIGESLKRLFTFRGDQVWGDVHLGDWGFQMGLLIVALEDEVGALEGPAFDRRMAALSLEDLEALYPPAAQRAKEDLAFRNRARKATAALQRHDAVLYGIWAHMKEVSMRALQREFADLGVDFDLWKGESDADRFIPDMVEELRDKGLLVSDQGAQVVHVARPGETRKKKLEDGSVVEVPSPDPLLVISSEGSAMYGTTDLATIVQRRHEYDPDLILYVVDQRQADHFEQVFRAAALAGYAAREELEHIGFGTMNGPDGKPFKTRAGGVLKLHDLIEMAREKARARLREAGLGEALEPNTFEQAAHDVAVAAIKFADLMNFRGTSYVFDLDRFVAFEGKTGPYLQYAAVRMRSMLRKANEQGREIAAPCADAPAERALILMLDGFEGALVNAHEKRAPHFLAEHAFALAQAFSVFYDQCPVLNEAEAATRAGRLGLTQLTLRQLEKTLELLGIAAPERM